MSTATDRDAPARTNTDQLARLEASIDNAFSDLREIRELLRKIEERIASDRT